MVDCWHKHTHTHDFVTQVPHGNYMDHNAICTVDERTLMCRDNDDDRKIGTNLLATTVIETSDSISI